MNEKEISVLDYIKKATIEGNSPSVREICKNTQIPSTSTVWSILSSLEKQGLIRVEHGKSRGIHLNNFDVSLVPLVDGADDELAKGGGTVGFVAFPSDDAKDVFALRALCDVAEIKSGDLVFFKHCYAAPPGTVGAFASPDGISIGIVGEKEGALSGKAIGFIRLF